MKQASRFKTQKIDMITVMLTNQFVLFNFSKLLSYNINHYLCILQKCLSFLFSFIRFQFFLVIGVGCLNWKLWISKLILFKGLSCSLHFLPRIIGCPMWLLFVITCPGFSWWFEVQFLPQLIVTKIFEFKCSRGHHSKSIISRLRLRTQDSGLPWPDIPDPSVPFFWWPHTDPL